MKSGLQPWIWTKVKKEHERNIIKANSKLYRKRIVYQPNEDVHQ